MNLSTNAIKENEIMEGLKNGVAAVFIVGIVGCVTVCVVSILNNQPVQASMSGSGGLVLSVGARAISGGKVG
jgi:hypothetical protein